VYSGNGDRKLQVCLSKLPMIQVVTHAQLLVLVVCYVDDLTA
jgi:hypothetical protein